jgi:DNA-binding transcriptional ArsR family regulator
MSPRPDPADPIFAALADPTRRRVILGLSERGPATATALARDLPVTRQAVAKHLAALQEAGLVTGERVGREHRYRLTPAPLADAVSWMTAVGAQWEQRLDRLRSLVQRRPR